MPKMNDAAWEQYVAIRDGYQRDPRWIALESSDCPEDYQEQKRIERNYQRSAEQYRLMP